MMPALDLRETSSRDVFFDIARGMHPDCTPIHLFGINTSIGTSFETIYDNGGGIYQFPATANTLDLASTDNDDTMGVKITGLDSNWNPITETVTLQGTTEVSTNQEFYRVNDARITGSTNAGDISIDHGDNTVAFIQQDKGLHQAINYSVPAGHSFLLKVLKFDGTIGLIGTMRFRAMLQDPAADDLVLHFWDSIARTDLDFYLGVPFPIPEKRDFSIEARGTTGTNQIACYAAGILVRN